ncbi:MAG TPA: hypothetical protein PLJ47_07410 [Candidatus Hydrogenedentes bacterium]|nr:hypothetical protein [Candidatus Hydrogenedentota bacterium]HRK34408.1 hypothetical protein [Candidatus Hydrogenedentota bacterium]
MRDLAIVVARVASVDCVAVEFSLPRPSAGFEELATRYRTAAARLRRLFERSRPLLSALDWMTASLK